MKKTEETLEQSMRQLRILIKTTKEVIDEIIRPMMPTNADKIINLSSRDRTTVDSLAMRYLRIQDMLANKIFGLFLEVTQEKTDRLTFIDQLNLLEKRHIIESADRWKDLRDLRNHLVHEYPDRPDLMADFLNQAYEAIPELIEIFEIIDQKLNFKK